MSPKRRDWVRRKNVVPHKTTIMFMGGTSPMNEDALFSRIFWKSNTLAFEARQFWELVHSKEPDGLPVRAWRDYCTEKNFTVGQFYNMIHGLVGAGMLEKKNRRWHTSTGFLRELERMIEMYSAKGGWTHT